MRQSFALIPTKQCANCHHLYSLCKPANTPLRLQGGGEVEAEIKGGDLESCSLCSPLVLYLVSIGARLKGSFPLWSVFSNHELWAFLSGSSLCPADLTPVSDGLSTSPKGAYSSVSCNNSLWALNILLIDIGPKVRSLSVLILQPMRTSCTHALWLRQFVNEEREKERDRSRPKGHGVKTLRPVFVRKFEQPSEVTDEIMRAFMSCFFSIYIKMTHPICYIKAI